MAILCVCIVFVISVISNAFITTATEPEVVTLSDDPSLWPGHMEPLGAKQIKEEIEHLLEYPSAEDFFSKYIKPGRPFLLKEDAKRQPAYIYWDDAYILSFPEAETELVVVEASLKENRTEKGFSTSLKKFIDTYRAESLYMINPVPSFLLKDVLIPTPLRCNNTRGLITNHVVWMSAGGTKSVLHNDDADNINCLFRGSKDILLIDPNKYDREVPIDIPYGAYSTVDVEKVNFTRYPSLREVKYTTARMVEGDCLFIPYKWHHQVNSVGNKDNQNIAVNIWFTHAPDVIPKYCDLSDEEMSLDHFIADKETYFSEKNEIGGDEGDNNGLPLIGLFNFTLREAADHSANLETFQAILHEIPGIFNESPYDHLTMSEEFKELGREIFNKLNVNKDAYFDEDDLKQILDDLNKADGIEDSLQAHMDDMTNIIREQLADETKSNREKETAVKNTDTESDEL